jgi:GntR family transcriptional repressor for pyruvate dehydrogenase complex
MLSSPQPLLLSRDQRERSDALLLVDPMPSLGKKEDLTARLLATFKQLISEGAIAPGARLPAEREMASSLRVSRGSLRQVLKMLEIMGVVSQRVGDGTYLNGAAPSILAEPMEFLILLDGISFAELMDARLIVEPELAARAASRATREEAAALRQWLTRMEASRNDHAGLIEADLQFHRAIFQMAQNRVCSLLFSIVHELLHGLMEVTSQMVKLEHTVRLHRRIYAAIRKGEPEEARARMFEHLTDAKQLLIRSHQARVQARLGSRLSTLSLVRSAQQQ